jgi:hypothetical protein
MTPQSERAVVLPELPPANGDNWAADPGKWGMFSRDQLRAYATAAVLADREARSTAVEPEAVAIVRTNATGENGSSRGQRVDLLKYLPDGTKLGVITPVERSTAEVAQAIDDLCSTIGDFETTSDSTKTQREVDSLRAKLLAMYAPASDAALERAAQMIAAKRSKHENNDEWHAGYNVALLTAVRIIRALMHPTATDEKEPDAALERAAQMVDIAAQRIEAANSKCSRTTAATLRAVAMSIRAMHPTATDETGEAG